MSSNRNENRTKPVIVSMQIQPETKISPKARTYSFDEKEGLRRAAEYLHLAKLSLKTGNSRMHEELLDCAEMEEIRIDGIKNGYLVVMIARCV